MDEHADRPTPGRNRTTVERKSDRELVVTRAFDAPARILFEAWTTPDLFMRWWAPKSMGVPLRACDMDVRVGGTYRVVFGKDASETFEFFGRYVDVVPNQRLVWTNEEDENAPLTTVTFGEQDGTTILVLLELYPTKEALDEAMAGMPEILPEQFNQLDDLLADVVAHMGGG